jgi:hypothetical protein
MLIKLRHLDKLKRLRVERQWLDLNKILTWLQMHWLFISRIIVGLDAHQLDGVQDDFGLIDLEALPNHFNIVLVDWALAVVLPPEAHVVITVVGRVLILNHNDVFVVHRKSTSSEEHLACLFRGAECEFNVITVEQMLLDSREGFLRLYNRLGADGCALAVEADIAVAHHFM